MAKPPTTETDLEIIGTARNPNDSDLKERGLTGLPDPGPEVATRRAKFDSEQAELKARVRFNEGEIPVSFLRTKMHAQKGEGDAVSSNWGKRESVRGEEVDVERSRGEEKIPEVTARVGISKLPDLPVANETCCGSEKVVYDLRDRSAVQLRPYAVERELYRQMVKAGKVKA